MKAVVAKGKVVKSKQVAKSTGKAVAKPPAKPVAKPAGKAKAGKPLAKPTKPASLVKKAAQVVAKPAAKPVAKASAKAVPKPVKKPLANVIVSKKVAAKSAAKAAKPNPPASKAPASVKPSKLNAVVSIPKSPAAKTATTTAQPVVKPEKLTKAVKPAAVAAPIPVKLPTEVTGPSGVPQKTGRPSSRLAQLTVPSMAQSVASTAAKSSFTQSTALPLITPPMASAVKKDPKLANNWKTKTADQLTDAELIAMPDSEYMGEKQMAAFRLKLLILRQEILASAGETTEHLREDTVVVPDPADRATIEEEHALELRTRDRERKLLKKIEQSINRIDAGDYGYCDETGEAIGVARLIARPTATLSLEAQQRRELKQKMFGD